MAAKFFVILSLAAAACALPVLEYQHEEPAHYEFQYSVHDSHTGDLKQQEEARAGDAVHGSYSLLQPDGVRRIVHYTADKENGFNAEVTYEGHPTEAPAKIAYAAPVAKIAYSAPVEKVTYSSPIQYAAPVAKVAYSSPIQYAAPVAKVAYSSPIQYAAPVAKVAYSSPIQYAAPVAKVAYSSPIQYAAPVAKVAYAQPLSHVTFASPAISYHH